MYRYEELDVWKKSANLCTEIYKELNNLKDFGFRDQITRSVLSIPSNIAEGYERDAAKDAVKFLKYSRGSAGELRTQIYIGMKIGYINPEKGKKWVAESEEISKMLRGLMKKLTPP